MDLKETIRWLRDAKTVRAVFGDRILERYKELQTKLHPDRYPEAEKKDAETAFKLLGEWYTKAFAPIATIHSPTRTYEVAHRHATGDLCDVHLCKDGVLIKVLRDARHNALMTREFDVTTAINKAADGLTYAHYFPTPIESFALKEKGHRVRTANAFKDPQLDNLYTLEQVISKFPKGIDPRDLAWMLNRMLTAVGFAHLQGVVHGAVLPCHVLIRADNHGLVLVDWTQSVDIKQPLKLISKKYREWYPKEVFDKQPATPGTDIYMVARCAIALLRGSTTANIPIPGQLPARLRNFLEACLIEAPHMRPQDAWQLHEDLGTTLKTLYGPRTFRPFPMMTA